MLIEVTSAELFVDERIRIVKNRLAPSGIDPRSAAADRLPRISVVTGIHGDELEGQYVAFSLARRIEAERENLAGIVDIYPALNPLGVNSITRSVPLFDLDMNRIFPGNDDSSLIEYVAAGVCKDIAGSDLALDIHASNIYLREIPQVRINETTADKLVPLARRLNIDFVWVHASATVLESTLAYSLNALGTPTLVIEAGVGMRITRSYGDQLCDGIFNLMSDLGIWKGARPGDLREPIVSTDGEVSFVNADSGGIFLPSTHHGAWVHQDEELGMIADAATGEVREVLRSPSSGLLFTLREYPIVYPGSLIARVLGGVSCK